MPDADKRILVGRIAGVFGVKGWVKVMSYTSPRENILQYMPWQLKLKGDWREQRIQDWKAHNKGLTVAFAGINDRDAARAFTGADIAVMRSQLKELAKGEYYHDDLVGMQVVNREGQTLGQVQEIMATGANDVLVINGDVRRLVPLMWNTYLLEIDQDAGIIRVDWDVTY